jgi:hypothetical protein
VGRPLPTKSGDRQKIDPANKKPEIVRFFIFRKKFRKSENALAPDGFHFTLSPIGRACRFRPARFGKSRSERQKFRNGKKSGTVKLSKQEK